MNEEVRHFSLRKLSIGLASVLVGISVFGASQTVKADTVVNSQASAVTNNSQSSDTQENKNAVKSSFSANEQDNSIKSNVTQTQENNQKQDQVTNVQQTFANSQETNNSNNSGADEGAIRTSSLQKTNNQSNGHAKNASQTQPKNSQKFNQKMLATNLIETTSSPTTNGGFDEATWGKLDVNNWQGSVQDGVYR